LQRASRAGLIDRVEHDVLRALARGDPPMPASLSFLLRRYLVSERHDIGDRVGQGLAVALTRYHEAAPTIERADWLRLFVEAALASDDDRISGAIAELVEALSAEWPTHDGIERAGASIDACLQASNLSPARALVQRAVDELERIVGISYRPGAAARSVGESVRLSAALLTAFAITARLPYAMLAEELVQAMRRSHWDNAAGLFAASLTLNCEAARVVSRIAALHRDAEYRAAAIIAPDADYDRDADALIESLAGQIASEEFPSAAFGLALIECAWPPPEPADLK
jgi:hypothetical protein